MSKYTLTYFNARGGAEPVRYMFAVAGVEYEDKRMEREDWPALKAEQPFGEVPVLTVNGKQLPQSKAIYRYVAREHGFYGANSWEAALVDVVFETCDEFTVPMIKLLTEDDQEKKEALRQYVIETSPKIMAKLEKSLKQNKNGEGWFVGDKLSIADILFVTVYDRLVQHISDKVLDDFPTLQALVSRIKAQKEIAEWIAKRPKTQF